jgi:hypothetical protein
MHIGIKGSNNEPQGTNKMARKERVRMSIVQHDKDDDDTNGTIEVNRHVRLPRSGSRSLNQ